MQAYEPLQGIQIILKPKKEQMYFSKFKGIY